MENTIVIKKNNFFTVSAWSTIAILIIMPIQIIIFVLSPHPDSVQGWLLLFKDNWILGLIHLDGLYIINNVLISIIYVALFILLVKEQPTKMILALLLGLLGISAYFASNKAVEMFFLSKEYWSISSILPKEVYLAAAQNMLLEWNGTAYDIYYILNAVALLLIASAMFRSQIIKRRVAVTGLISGFLMLIPANFGTIGIIFALTSLIPWYVFSIMITRVFFYNAKQSQSISIV